MGKRKSAAMKPKPNRVPKLDKEFDCPFCSHSKAVKVELDRVRGIGALSCRVCGAAYNRSITRLDEGIDVYGDWIDACVSANAEAAKEAQQKLEKAPIAAASQGGGAHSRGPPPVASESASEGETEDRGRARKERFALTGGSRMGLKKLNRETVSEREGSSSEEAEDPAPRGGGEGPESSEGAPSRKRLKVDKSREDEEDVSGESDGTETERQAQNFGDPEVGGVLDLYRKEAEGEEEAEEGDTALFHDDE
ncbi:hypothetical protein ACSSS7_005328 [Eimeria intestinalis]